MNHENRERFLDHAMRQCPREACGLLTVTEGAERLQLCDNISDTLDQFTISPNDFLTAAKHGEVVGVVHSHCFIPPFPSDADLVGCEANGYPWYIVSVPTGAWHSFKPSGYRAPLIGRNWSHGTLDCYGLIKDYYQERLGFEIPDFERVNDWWEKGLNLYSPANLQSAGFVDVPLEELRKHDVLLMQVHSKVINHAGVYLGNDLFLHHLNKRLSSRDIWAGYWRKHTVKAVRYSENS